MQIISFPTTSEKAEKYYLNIMDKLIEYVNYYSANDKVYIYNDNIHSYRIITSNSSYCNLSEDEVFDLLLDILPKKIVLRCTLNEALHRTISVLFDLSDC